MSMYVKIIPTDHNLVYHVTIRLQTTTFIFPANLSSESAANSFILNPILFIFYNNSRTFCLYTLMAYAYYFKVKQLDLEEKQNGGTIN
jgi:hypothetical protein